MVVQMMPLLAHHWASTQHKTLCIQFQAPSASSTQLLMQKQPCTKAMPCQLFSCSCCSCSCCSLLLKDLVKNVAVRPTTCCNCSTCCLVKEAAKLFNRAISNCPNAVLLASTGCCTAACSADTTLGNCCDTCWGANSSRDLNKVAWGSRQQLQLLLPLTAVGDANALAVELPAGMCPSAATSSSSSSLHRHMQRLWKLHAGHIGEGWLQKPQKNMIHTN